MAAHPLSSLGVLLHFSGLLSPFFLDENNGNGIIYDLHAHLPLQSHFIYSPLPQLLWPFSSLKEQNLHTGAFKDAPVLFFLSGMHLSTIHGPFHSTV